MAKTVLALDFGGTKLAAGLWAIDTALWLGKVRCDTPSDMGAGTVVQTMLRLGDSLTQDHSLGPLAVGISFDGPVSAGRDRVVRCHHVADWEDYPLPACIAAHYGCPAAMDNDANLAAWAEQRHGAAFGCRDVLYMTVSTGVGGGLVLGGELYRGCQGLAGEIGHMCLDPNGPSCPCGRQGCLEAMAAGPAIVRWAREAADHTLAGDLTAADVHAAAERGAGWAREAMAQAAQALGLACANALNLLNLECVVLGGGVMRAGKGFLQRVQGAAEEHVLPGIAVDIRRATLHGEAPLRGAAMLAQALI